MSDAARAALDELAAALTARAGDLAVARVVAGFDGFIDEMISVVGERQSLSTYAPVPTIAEFGRLISAAAGRSSLREIVVRRVDPGGCAVNFGDGIARLGVQLDYFGTLGTPRHPAFDAFAAACRSCTSWGREPGRTLACEFSDGKYMLSSVAQLAEIEPGLLARELAEGRFAAACAAAQLIAITNWTLYPHMTACWRFLRETVFAKLPARPRFFFDLVDPTSRSTADIRAMLDELRAFAGIASVTLGLNGNEGNVLARLFGIPANADAGASLADQAAALRSQLGVHAVVIHGVRAAAIAEVPDHAAPQGDSRCTSAPGPWCASPRKLTGAGDRFNAGYAAGVLLGLPATQRLLLGNAASGYFVRQADSADAPALAQFCSAWAAGRV